ncbi:MAG: hypothetical protein QXS38_00430 [Candidatus Pacearchaeota archaeon]
MNKRGQFFLIAALIIVGVIITLTAINISTKPSLKEQTTLYDLSKEIDYESSKLIDYGVYAGQPQEQTAETIVSLVSNYSMANPDTDLLLIYGNKDSLTVLYYNKSLTGSVGFNLGGGAISGGQYVITPVTPSYNVYGNEVDVTLAEGHILNFDLQPGQNFFIVLKKEVGGEVIVAQE